LERAYVLQLGRVLPLVALQVTTFSISYPAHAQQKIFDATRIDLEARATCPTPPPPGPTPAPVYVVEAGQAIDVYLSVGACAATATAPLTFDFFATKYDRQTYVSMNAIAALPATITLPPTFPAAQANSIFVGTLSFAESGDTQSFCYRLAPSSPQQAYPVFLGYNSCTGFIVRERVRPVPLSGWIPAGLGFLIASGALVWGARGRNW
jgi:hypothetical protein